MKTENAAESNPPIRIPLYDVHESAFLILQGLIPEVESYAGKTLFSFPATETFEQLTAAYHMNASVRVLDFTNVVRMLRAKIQQNRNAR